MLAPALLLEVLLALGLLVVVPKSLLVVVPSLASVVIHDSWRCFEMNHPVGPLTSKEAQNMKKWMGDS